jgi:hypothetical protein
MTGEGREFVKLAVGYPWSSPFIFTNFAENISNLERPDGFDVRFFRGVGWCAARRHISFCQKALDWGADLICIIGADQVHPEDMLKRLVARIMEGYEVIAALVPCRGYVHWQPMMPFQPMAWSFKTNTELGTTKYRNYEGMQISGDLVHIIKREDGDVVPVNFIGSGVIMFQRDHLLSLKKPWFYETVNHEDQQRIANMDCTFVWRLQSEAGARIYVDTTIMVRHSHVFEIDDSYSDRFADWARGEVGDKNICSFEKPEDVRPYTTKE